MSFFNRYAFSRVLNRSMACSLISILSIALASSAQALPKDEGAKNLGGSTYFSWKIKNPISGLDNAPKVIGYACLTRDTIGGIAKNATLSRYAIKAVPKSDRWWLEYQEGFDVLPGDTSYRAKRTIEGMDAKTLQKEVTNAETGWFKRDFEVDALGFACINGGISGVVKHLEKTHVIKITVENPKRG